MILRSSGRHRKLNSGPVLRVVHESSEPSFVQMHYARRRPSRTNRITNRCGRIRNIFGRILLNDGIDVAGTMIFKSSVSRVTLGRNMFRKSTFTKKMRYVRTSRLLRFSRRDLSYESENSKFRFWQENSLQMRNEPSESSLRSNRTICER